MNMIHWTVLTFERKSIKIYFEVIMDVAGPFFDCVFRRKFLYTVGM